MSNTSYADTVEAMIDRVDEQIGGMIDHTISTLSKDNPNIWGDDVKEFVTAFLQAFIDINGLAPMSDENADLIGFIKPDKASMLTLRDDANPILEQ